MDVALSVHIDVSLIKTDVQPEYVRLLVKGRLLQLRLPCQVDDQALKTTNLKSALQVLPDLSKAERSLTTGHLVITMPKEQQNGPLNMLFVRSNPNQLRSVSKLPSQSMPYLRAKQSKTVVRISVDVQRLSQWFLDLGSEQEIHVVLQGLSLERS